MLQRRPCRYGIAPALFLAAGLLCAPASGQIQLFQDFDSGSLHVDTSTIDAATPSAPVITLDPRGTAYGGDVPYSDDRWWWMYFGATGVAGATPQFRAPESRSFVPITNGTRYVYSYDQQNWSFFDNGQVGGGVYSFSNDSPFTHDTVYVAVGLPYPVSRTDALVASVQASPYVQPTASADANLVIGPTLGTAGGGYVDDLGRDIPGQNLYGFRITDPAATGAKTKIALITGNHRGETPSCYVVEGLIHFLIGDDPGAAELRTKAEFYVYPQVDPEGRWAGFYRSTPQNPTRNHNRVWGTPAGFTEIEVVTAAMKADTGSSVDYFFDFHSMWQPDETYPLCNTPLYHSEFAQALAARDPEHGNGMRLYDFGTGYAQGWAASAAGLNARYSGTPELGFLANQGPDRYFEIGRNYALALNDVLTGDEPPPPPPPFDPPYVAVVAVDFGADGQAEGEGFSPFGAGDEAGDNGAVQGRTFGDYTVTLTASADGDGPRLMARDRRVAMTDPAGSDDAILQDYIRAETPINWWGADPDPAVIAAQMPALTVEVDGLDPLTEYRVVVGCWDPWGADPASGPNGAELRAAAGTTGEAVGVAWNTFPEPLEAGDWSARGEFVTDATGLMTLQMAYVDGRDPQAILNYLIIFPQLLTGDANCDGEVGIADLWALADNYGVTTGATWAMGDLNGDGAVGIADLSALADNYGRTIAAGTVPEPGAVLLLAACAAWVARLRRR